MGLYKKIGDNIYIYLCEIDFRAEWINSLKEKRAIIKRLIERSKNKFNISIIESNNQDSHKDLSIAFVLLSNDKSHADKSLEKIIAFLESLTDAYISSINTSSI